MYQALLTRRYLTSKIMPLLAIAAVSLSVGTVLVTWSVMGGFLKTLLQSGRTLIGDVAITWPNIGFAHYQDLIDRLQAHDAVRSATPIIETYGLVGFGDDSVHFAQVRGVDGPSYAAVTSYAQALWWRPISDPVRRDSSRQDVRLQLDGGYTDSNGRPTAWGWDQLLIDGLSLSEPDNQPAAVPGIGVSGRNQRTSGGIYLPLLSAKYRADGGVELDADFLPHGSVTLHVLPLDSTGRPRVEVITRTVPVANEFESGVFDVDARTVLVRLDLLQNMLGLDEALRLDPDAPAGPRFNPATGEFDHTPPSALSPDPARVTSVLVRGVDAEGREQLESLRAAVEDVYAAFEDAHPGQVPPPQRIAIRTWRDLNAGTIAAVEKETGLVLFVFGLVCFTTVFLVLAIFWSMVSEKTRDIGILRALGAGTPGVAWLWIRYGGAIGLVGSALGVGGAYAVIRHINQIHEWLGTTFGLVIWDPAVYVFTQIPTDMDPLKTVTVAAAGVLTCLLGATWPALRAGLMAPVRALRFE